MGLPVQDLVDDVLGELMGTKDIHELLSSAEVSPFRATIRAQNAA